MILIEKTEIYGFPAAIRGMRNPLNSWEKSDSYSNKSSTDDYEWAFIEDSKDYYKIGPNDLELAAKLCKAGNDHSKFRRMIHVSMDITAPLYWWKEFDTYKVGTVANSCSTMHKIGSKVFEASDFSIEHLGVRRIDIDDETGEEIKVYQNLWIDKTFQEILDGLNIARRFYLQEEDPKLKKEYWWQMIQLLPTSYNQKRTVDLNYQVLSNIFHARKNHKLDEWHVFCKWIDELPYSEELILGTAESAE